MTSLNYYSKLITTGLILGLSIAIPSVADTHGANDYINLGIGIEGFDNDRQLKSEELFSLGYEHRYNSNWAAEIFITDLSPRPKGGGGSIDLTQYGLDALYYFDQSNPDSDIQPYGAIGLGISSFNGSSNEEAQVRVGLGLRYLLGDHWSLRGDTRLLYSEETHNADNIFSIGLSYAFSPQKVAKAVVVMEKDSDGDGVLDDNEECPTTATGISVDSKGCPLDSDKDGVPDHRDHCPDSPVGVAVNDKGCIPDDDGDGVSNNSDQCPNTETGASVDTKGCMLDGDNDGVGNHLDQCPTTPAGRQVDEMGCKYVLKRTEEMTLNINFASNSSIVSQDQYSEIESVAKLLQKYGDVSTVIEGHTDDRGSAGYNQKLSQSRANAVRNVLIETYGIAANRVTAQGFGETNPIETNDTKEGRLANRRVVAVMETQIVE